MSPFFIWIILSVTTFSSAQLRDKFRFVTVEICASNNTVLDPLKLSCAVCPKDSTSKSGRTCVCRQGFIESKRVNYKQVECQACPVGQVSSQSRLRCLTCGKGQCSRCPEGNVFVETEFSTQCQPCSSINFPTAECTRSGERQTLVRDTDPDFPAFNKHSDLISSQITIANEKCKTGVDCNLLANFCVLSNYRMSQTQESPCTLYLKLTPPASRNPMNGPWIYYDEEPTQALYKTNLPNKFTLDPSKNSSFLEFHALSFDLAGNFIKDGELPIRDLIPCAQIPTRLPFAANIDVTCKVTVNDLLEQALRFIDIYLVSDSKLSLYPVPILVRNLFKNGVSINKLGGLESQWQLTRRIFTVDAKSTPGTIRYIKSIHIRVRLQSWWDGRAPGSAYPPLISVTYGRIHDQSRQDVEMHFHVHYEQIQSKTFQDISIAIGVLSTLVAMWACIRTWGWVRRNGTQSFGAIGIYKLVAYSCGGLADTFLLVVFSSCLNWLVMFKAQGIIHLLLPTTDQESEIITYISIALGLKVIEVVDAIAMQQDWDVFLIDWELTEGATAWRSYLIAGEFLKLITHRRLSIGLLLLTTIFALKVANLESLALSSPATVDISSDITPFSSTCRLGLVAVIFIVSAVVFYLYVRVLHERLFGHNAMQRFVDLCSITNISMLTLSHSCYGYYIHGRSVLGKSDVTLWEILEQLRKEENDLCAHRGLIPDTDEQTFRISLLSQLKIQYNRLLEGANASPQSIERLAASHKAINRFFVAFLQHAVKDLDYVVRDAMAVETFLDVELNDVHDRCVFYKDPNGRTLEALLFSNFEKNLLLLDLLVLVVADWITHDIVLASCVVYLIDAVMSKLRTVLLKRNLVKKSLIDARFITN